MNNRLPFALVIALAAAPAAGAQTPVKPGQEPAPDAVTKPGTHTAPSPFDLEHLAALERLARTMRPLAGESAIAEAKRMAEEARIHARALSAGALASADALTSADALASATSLAASDARMQANEALLQTTKALAQMDMELAQTAPGVAGKLAEIQERSRDRDADLRERDRNREAQFYSEGQNAADEYQWDRALTYFNRVIEMKGSRLDAALYWKAFTQNRLGQRAEALTTIAELNKSHPNSSYRRQANILEAEVRRDIGQPVRPQESADDDVKLMALQALQNTAPEEAIPMIEKVLEGTSGRRVKQRALFVLAQSKSPRAREVLRNYAKGSSTPELQSQAIQYLGVHGGPESRAVLAEAYEATTDVDVKRRILRAFMVAGEKKRLLDAAQREQNADLRAEAVGQLGNMQAHEELWQLYQKETSVDVKRRIVRAMHVGGGVDRLIELAKAEQNPEVRREVIRSLGLTRAARTGDVLVQIYGSDTNPDVRKAVVNGLFIQENAAALVTLARKEQDAALRKEIVSRLSQMRSKVATDYMIELLGK